MNQATGDLRVSPQKLVACLPPHEPFLDHGKMAGVVVAGLELQAAQQRLLHDAATLNRVAHDVTESLRGDHHG